MSTKPLKWPENADDWPADQSNAAQDRNDAAFLAANISHLARNGQDMVVDGQITQRQLIYIFSKIDQAASDICRLMERNGAPTRPFVINDV